MTTKQELLDLAERVEGADAWRCVSEVLEALGYKTIVWHQCVCNALNGSIDAAKALHDAVLPGWEWSVSSETNINDGFAEVEVYTEKDKHLDVFASAGKVANPAAAWVAAILRAKAEEL